MELPELEEILLKLFPNMLLSVAYKEKSVLEYALKAGSKSDSDPINLIKLLVN